MHRGITKYGRRQKCLEQWTKMNGAMDTKLINGHKKQRESEGGARSEGGPEIVREGWLCEERLRE